MFSPHALQAGFLPGNERILQGLHLGLVLLQEPQARPRHVVGRAMATGLSMKSTEGSPSGTGVVRADDG